VRPGVSWAAPFSIPPLGRATATPSTRAQLCTFLDFTYDLMPLLSDSHFCLWSPSSFDFYCPRASILRYAIQIYYYHDTMLICYRGILPASLLSPGRKLTRSKRRASRRLNGYWAFLRRRYTAIDESRFSLPWGMQQKAAERRSRRRGRQGKNQSNGSNDNDVVMLM
jgi:hypothetical protein